jgi:hypothetical protein
MPIGGSAFPNTRESVKAEKADDPLAEYRVLADTFTGEEGR